LLVLITGASGGLGYELAKRFSESNFELILIQRASGRLNLKEEFPEAIILNIDFLKESIKCILDKYTFDKLPDIIIHCAGGKLEEDTHPINSDILLNTMKLNFFSVVEINNFFINKSLKINGKLRIIHISSVAGVTGRASPSYSISKGALNTYIKNIGREYASHNIMICGLICGIFEHPTSVWTKKKIDNPKYYFKVKNESTLRRFANVKEIADIVVDVSNSKSMLYSAELITITAGNI